MAKIKKSYNHPGGVIAFPRAVLKSAAYNDLSCNARAMMLEFQNVWKPHEPTIHYSVRRVAEKLKVSLSTASRLLKELADHDFIEVAEESHWLNGKAREYHLKWLPAHNREPSNDWMNWAA